MVQVRFKRLLTSLYNILQVSKSGDRYEKKVCIVAIAKDEDRFIDEWLVYHKLIGVDHIFVYDDNCPKTLVNSLAKYSSFVTVIPWERHSDIDTSVRNQILAYSHSLDNYLDPYEWVCFLDIDEFVVFRGIDCIRKFIKKFSSKVSSISLNWHVFGHNGYFEDPKDLVIAALTRRMALPNHNVKSITRVKAIKAINQHKCEIKFGLSVDANCKTFSRILYKGRSRKAHVNHYQCRSFQTWMRRAERGDVNFSTVNSETTEMWRFTNESLLKQFVLTVAVNKNELLDEYMIRFKKPIEDLFAYYSEKSCKKINN